MVLRKNICFCKNNVSDLKGRIEAARAKIEGLETEKKGLAERSSEKRHPSKKQRTLRQLSLSQTGRVPPQRQTSAAK